MNKIKSTAGLALACCLLLNGCSSANKYLDRPEDTNLTYWITQELSEDDLSKMTYIPGTMGGGEYLDAAYTADKNDNSNYTVPAIHVTYLVTPYPDYSDTGYYVTAISISDPKISIYGLTLNATDDQVTEKFKSLGFSIDDDTMTGSARLWNKNNCLFYFDTGKKIGISATVSNKNNIIY